MIDFPGPEGFLGTRASLMLDVVTIAMGLVLVLLGISIAQVRKQRYQLHKVMQISIALLLLVAVTAFEIEMRVYGWQGRAAGVLGGSAPQTAMLALYVHLVFAVSTLVLWPLVIYQALRRFPSPPGPNEFSPKHRRLARIAAADMLMTTLTGWIFYFVAFVG